MKTGHPVVDAITELRFEGSIIDHRWLGHPLLRHESGRFNSVAAMVLADICSLYRSRINRDPVTSSVVSVTPKFDGQELYKDYQEWADTLGFTKRQMQDAVAFLKKAGLVRAWAGPVTLRSGVVTNNLIHIEPVPEAIRAMTFGAGQGLSLQREAGHEGDMPPVAARGVSRSKVRPHTAQRDASTVHTQDSHNNQHQNGAKAPVVVEDPFDLIWKSLDPATQKSLDRKAAKSAGARPGAARLRDARRDAFNAMLRGQG